MNRIFYPTVDANMQTFNSSTIKSILSGSDEGNYDLVLFVTNVIGEGNGSNPWPYKYNTGIEAL